MMAFVTLLKNAVKCFPSQFSRSVNSLFYNGSHNIHHLTEALLGSTVSRLCGQNQKLVTPISSLACRKFSGMCEPVLQPPALHVPLVTNVRHKARTEMKMLYYLHRRKPKPPKTISRPLDGRPQMKGVVLRTLIKKPKKPNSANRKCVLLRLSNGKEAVAYVPGVGHNLQEHNVVLVECGRTQDVPGLKLKVIRGKYDCAPVIKRSVTP